MLKKAVIPMMYSDKTKNILEDMNFKGKILDIRKLDSFNAEEISKETEIEETLEVDKDTEFETFLNINYANLELWQVEIPKINLIAPIAQDTTQEVMEKYVGHFAKTAFWKGNIGLAAHNRRLPN